MRTTIVLILVLITTLLNAQKLEKIWSSAKDLNTPESVLFNTEYNTIFVACMGKKTDTKDKDGYIAQMNLKGEITKLKWVPGLKDPKGMAIWKEKLYVSDMNELVVINISEAKIEKKFAAPASKFLNDVTVNKNGVVFVSDMRDQRIYKLENDKFESWIFDSKLENVNGLWVEDDKLYAGNNYVWEIDFESKDMKQLFGNTGGIDGLEAIGKDRFVFSNWEGKIYVSDKGEVTKLLDTSKQKINTADIDFVPDQKIVLVPTFFGNNVEAYKLSW